MHVKPEQVNQLFTAAPQQTSIIRILCQRHTIISKTNYVAARLASGANVQKAVQRREQRARAAGIKNGASCAPF
ncbi:hypothetical protein EM595_0685 [Duffyella gerundensis]|uniref:Uncharacterized protein n=1 Tax=Duffyella gerundensis TaxID=1619313 RepID=A0A0U5KXM8_9GAMM|nr:hypothetical protein EM595_0685 [Duffyella gerundensis]